MYPYMSNASNSSKDSEKPIKAAEKDNSSVPENDARITELILKAIASETESADGYKNLMATVVDSRDRETIRSMYLDELRHKKLLSAMLENPSIIPADLQYRNIDAKGIQEVLSEAIINEIEAARFYRDLAIVMEPQYPSQARTILSIMNDEQNHAVLDSYLFTKYQDAKAILNTNASEDLSESVQEGSE